MSPAATDLLIRVTRTIADLAHTEGALRRQRAILTEQATRLRTGEPAPIVAARLREARVWALGDPLASAEAER